MRTTIGKKYRFSAAHKLTGVGDNHQCAKMHGHNYAVVVEVSQDVSKTTGMVVDFHQIGQWMKPILEDLDHGTLNDILDNPTSERLALYIMDRINRKHVSAVTVWETCKCWARVER